VSTVADLLGRGWSVVRIEPPLTPNGFTSGAELKARTLAGIASALAFPEHFGGNLDALADCLRDIATPTLLLWEGWWWLARVDPDAFAAIREIFARRARGGGFVAVVVGVGLDVDLPELE